MKKKLLVILLSVLAMTTAVFGLTACDDSSGSCEHNFTVVKEAKKSTCSEAGTRQVKKCNNCGIYYIPATFKEYDSEDDAFEAAKLGGGAHNVEYVKETEPISCNVPGYSEHYKCKVCNKVFSDPNGKTQINLNDVKIEGEHNLSYIPAVEAGCFTAGNYSYYKCDDCERLFSDGSATQETTLENVTISAVGHDFEHGHHERVEPTCMYGGSIEYYSCSRCQKWYTEETAENEITNHDDIWLSVLEHDYSVTTTVQEADCEIDEIIRYSCKNGCDYYEDVTTENSAIGHSFANGKCTNCECDEFSLGLEIGSDYWFDGYVITGIGSWQTEDVLILPNTYKGEKVEAVNIENTDTLNGVKKIIIPENIKWVKFSESNSVTEVVIKSSEMTFAEGAFSGFTALKTLTVPEEFTVKGIGSSAFTKTAIEKFTFDGDYDVIDNGAFYECANLTEIYIPSSATEIRTNAFYECTSLEKVIIDDIKDWAKIYVYSYLESNPLYYAHHFYKKTNDGIEPYGDIVIDESVLDADYLEKFKKIRQNIFKYCYDIVKVVIPNGIEEIDVNAFENCINLEEVELCSKSSIDGHTLTKIGQESFMGCSSLKYITVPSTLNTIHNQAFKDCEAISHVYFAGDEEAWRDTWLSIYFSDYTANPMYAGNSTLYLYDGSSYYSTEQAGVNIRAQLVDGKRQSFEIKNNAFAGFSTKIYGIDYANKIGEYAFYNAKGVQGYLELDGVAGMANDDYPDNFQGVTYVGTNAFYGCENIATVKFGNYLEEIADYAFEGSGIKELIMLGTSTKVGYAILNNCESVERLQLAFLGDMVNTTYTSSCRLDYYFGSTNGIPSTLEMISVEDGNTYRSYSLAGARGLKHIYLPEDFYIPYNVLGSGANPLESLTIYYKGSLKDWIDNGGLGEDNLSQAITLYVYEGGQYDLVDDLVIPETITNGVRDSIGLYTFANVVSITKVTVHANFKFDTTTKYVFKGCVNLSQVYNYTSTILTAGANSYYYIARYATNVYNGLS